MQIFRTFIKWQFWLSLLLMGLALFGVYHFVFKIWLPSFTHHNQKIEVPDLSEMNIHDAMAALDKLKLTYEIDSVMYDTTRPKLAIIEYTPEGGEMVKQGRRIFIKSNPNGWRPVLLPDLVGKSKRLAFTQLNMANLVVGDTIFVPDIARDAVLRVMYKGEEISKDFELPRFAKVDLVLGQGLEFGVKLANMKNRPLASAKAAILSDRFEVGRIIVEGNVTDSSKLVVFYQYPLAGDNYDQGLPVDLWVFQSTEDPAAARELNTHLQSRVKDLDRQFRNFGDNDSIVAEKYAEQLKLDNTQPKKIPKDSVIRRVVVPEEKPELPSLEDMPDGFEVE